MMKPLMYHLNMAATQMIRVVLPLLFLQESDAFLLAIYLLVDFNLCSFLLYSNPFSPILSPTPGGTFKLHCVRSILMECIYSPPLFPPPPPPLP